MEIQSSRPVEIARDDLFDQNTAEAAFLGRGDRRPATFQPAKAEGPIALHVPPDRDMTDSAPLKMGGLPQRAIFCGIRAKLVQRK